MKPTDRYKKDSKGRPVYEAPKHGKSRWPKGVSGNLKGRKKGSTNRYSTNDIIRAIKFVEQTNAADGEGSDTFLGAWIKAAWGNAADMAKLMRFMLPELKSIEGIIGTFDASMSDERALEIQKELLQRYQSKASKKGLPKYKKRLNKKNKGK